MDINKPNSLTYNECKNYNNIPEEILNIINKTKLSTKELVSSENSTVVEFLKGNYYKLNMDKLNYYFSGVFFNLDFLEYVNTYVCDTFKNIFNDNESYDFEKISFSMFLLSGLEYSHPFKDINNYNYESFSLILGDALRKIENSDNQKEFNIYFDRFYNICELSNKLSIFNQIDKERHKLIEELLNIVREYINKFLSIKSSFLTEEHKNYILNIFGKLLLNFTHIHTDDIKSYDLDCLLNYIHEKINIQEKAFKQCEESDFGNDNSEGFYIKQVYIGNMTTMIFEMINQLLYNGFTFDEIKKSETFQNIINKYFEKIGLISTSIKGLSYIEFKNLLNNSLAYIYFEDDTFLGKTSNDPNGTILYDFINHNTHNSYQIETIFNIISFNIENFRLAFLLDVGEFLLDIGVYNNYNFEYFKLRIFDLIITKLDNEKLKPNTSYFLDKLINYIELNKTASQLLKPYSKLHKYIAYYYSNFNTQITQQKSKDSHYNFRKTNGLSIPNNTKGSKHNQFIQNIGEFYAGENNIELNDNNRFCFGVLSLRQHGEIMDRNNRSEIDSYLSNHLNNVLTDHELIENNKDFFKDLCNLLSSKIFYGVAQVYIKDDKVNSSFDLHNGMKMKEIELFNGYSLVFIYPKIHENLFNSIYDEEKDYITLNLKNLINSYLKTKENYEQTLKAFLDDLTGLPNQAKLNKDLSKIDTVSFLNIKLKSVSSINNGHSFEAGNTYIIDVANELQKIPLIKGNIYRLSGVQFGIIIHDENSIDNIIESINNIYITLGEFTSKLIYLIGGVKGCKEKYIEKTNRAISQIQKDGNNIAFYDENIHTKESYLNLIEYSSKLSDALENGKIITYYQDIVDANDTSKIYKREALMRILGDDGKSISPTEYLNAAKELGKLPQIAFSVIDIVFTDLKNNPDYSFSINLSGEDLSNQNLIPKIKESITKYSINPNSITFEILEGGWKSGDDKIEIIQQIKELGFKIAIDDFGAGESGINRLNKLFNLGIIDYIKIDGEILKNLGSYNEVISNSAKIDIKYIVDKARSMIDENGVKQSKVIAEFIENENIANKCIELGVDYLQGYHYSKPCTLVVDNDEDLKNNKKT